MLIYVWKFSLHGDQNRKKSIMNHFECRRCYLYELFISKAIHLMIQMRRQLFLLAHNSFESFFADEWIYFPVYVVYKVQTSASLRLFWPFRNVFMPFLIAFPEGNRFLLINFINTLMCCWQKYVSEHLLLIWVTQEGCTNYC